MKYLKLIIVLLVITIAVCGATYYFTRPHVESEGVVEQMSSNIRQKTIENDIDEKIRNAPEGTFCPKAYEDILKSINLFFEDEQTNLKAYTLMLQTAYTQKFVAQANYVFDRNAWNANDISIIRKELNRCQEFSDAAELDSISIVLSDYDKLLRYHNRVVEACNSRPDRDKMYSSYFNRWNVTKATELINSVPIVRSKAINSPLYRQTRLHEVKNKLKTAHYNYIQKKIVYAKEEIDELKENDINYYDILRNVSTLQSCLIKDAEDYYNKWKDSEKNLEIRKAINRLENYIGQ